MPLDCFAASILSSVGCCRALRSDSDASSSWISRFRSDLVTIEPTPHQSPFGAECDRRTRGIDFYLEASPLALTALRDECRSRRDALISKWERWAQESAGPDELRGTAAERMKAYLCTPSSDQALDLAGLNLSCLPLQLPDGAKKLDISGNRLTRLPEALPDSLVELDVGDNELTSLPEHLPASLQKLNFIENALTRLPAKLPRSLIELYVAHNKLTSLPDDLPAGLRIIRADCNDLPYLPESLPAELRIFTANENRLTRLPASLPAKLRVLCLDDNQLTSLPENLPSLYELRVEKNELPSLPEIIGTTLIRQCRLGLKGNPLSEEVLEWEVVSEAWDVCGNEWARYMRE